MISPARTAAFDILLRVEREQAYVSELLHSPSVDKLSAADRRLCTEIAMGVLRWQSVLDRSIQEHSAKPLPKLDCEVLIALRMADYQLGYLQRIPASAAVNDSVALVKRARKTSAAGFVNAVLRKAAKSPTVGDDEQLAHPQWLVDRWKRYFGTETAHAICHYNQQVPPTAVHLADLAAEEELKSAGIEVAPGALLRSARLIVGGDVTHTKAFRDGRLRIQDEASQLVALMVGRGQRILDCCAAPGGKTAILAERNPEAQILATDLHPKRAELLRRRVTAPNVQVKPADVIALAGNPDFDRVLADVPCSGTGTLARHPEIKWRLKPEDLSDLHRRQASILNAAIDRTATAGRILYSTCSLEREECEDVIDEVLRARRDVRLLEAADELLRLRDEGELIVEDISSLAMPPFMRTIPGRHPCDGFFAALLEKR